MTNTTTRPNSHPTTEPTLLAAREVKDFSLGAGLPDVRGWKVTGPAMRNIGTVDRIMLDSAEKKPRYLSVQLHEQKGSSVLFPIGVAVADAAQKHIALEGVGPEVLNALPNVSNAPITLDIERKIVQAFSGSKTTGTASDWYGTPLFNSARMQTLAQVA